MPELGPGQQREVAASLIDPDGLIARTTGAVSQNGTKKTSGPGIAAIATEFPARVVENDELATPLGLDSEWISSRTGVLRRHRAVGETLVDLAAELRVTRPQERFAALVPEQLGEGGAEAPGADDSDWLAQASSAAPTWGRAALAAAGSTRVRVGAGAG